MQYDLMHKNHRTAEITFDGDAEVESVRILDERYLPVLDSTRPNLSAWIRDRAVPEGRSGLSRMLEEAGCRNPNEYLVKNLGLSLTDSYWLCPKGEDLFWEDVNLFEHPAGSVLAFRDNPSQKKASWRLRSDSALTGSLDKYSVYKNNAWYMVKHGNGKDPFGLQNINEAFATLLHERQGFSLYTPYSLQFDEHHVCSACECRYFTSRNLELIHASNVIGGENGMPYQPRQAYEEYVKQCSTHGLSEQEIRVFMDYMILTDFLLTNTDRHWENFGILRNPETLEFVCPAPIYDSGTSMLFDEPYVRTRTALLRIECNGIDRQYPKLLSLVKDRHCVDVEKLPTREETAAFYADRGVPEDQAEQIANGFSLKRDMLMEYEMGYELSVSREFLYGTEPPVKNGVKNPDYRDVLQIPRFLVISDNDQGFIQSCREKLVNPVCIDAEDPRSAEEQIKKALLDGKDVLYLAPDFSDETRSRLKTLAETVSDVKLEFPVNLQREGPTGKPAPRERQVKR